MHESRASERGDSVTGRALAVLDSFDAEHRRQPLGAIARRTGLPLTTVHRLVHELERHEALVRGPDGDWEIGSKIWRLGTLASVHVDLREVALPYMEDVYALGNDAVQIAVLDGLRCLVVDRIAGSRTMSVLSKPGSRLPLHATGVGKVLLAFGTTELQEAVLGSLDRYTDRTITDAETLRPQLRTIRSQGFAVTREELTPGATSVAVPLRGRRGAVTAALGVVSPSESAEVSKMVPVLQVTAAALSSKLVETGLA
ncbi:MAG: IclR family transcriptional regulator [Actinomycetales bacterium]|nr:IclR family transcriptional regulator [Actinomycetales bacterium]